MKKAGLFATIIAATLLAGSAAYAGGPGHGLPDPGRLVTSILYHHLAPHRQHRADYGYRHRRHGHYRWGRHGHGHYRGHRYDRRRHWGGHERRRHDAPRRDRRRRNRG